MEKWEEIYTRDQLKLLQNIENRSLREFDRVCKVLNLQYILYGGTLLGAIKYRGFIPWDDDIDVAMQRDDYEKFIKYSEKIISNDYIIQTPYNEKRSPFAYCKMRLKGTKYIEKYNHKLNIEKGIYIDIYPIDDIPDDEVLRLKQFNKVQFLLKLYYFRQCLHVDMKCKKILIIKHTIMFFILRLYPQTFLVNRIDRVMKKYNNKGFKRKSCLFYPKIDNIYEKFMPFSSCEFQHFNYLIPCDYDNHLKLRYGNYKELPPKNERIGHKPYVLDFGIYGKTEEDIRCI